MEQDGQNKVSAYRIPVEVRLRAVSPKEVHPELLVIAHGLRGCSLGEAVLYANERAAAPGFTHLFFWISVRGVFVRMDRIWGLKRGSRKSRDQQERRQEGERYRRFLEGTKTAPIFGNDNRREAEKRSC